MKYVVVLGDGMSDYPVPELGGKTPLQAAATPTMDLLAQRGEMGMVRTIPQGMPPGSDTANLAVLGYDPRRYYAGRSPFEAASMGVPLADTDTSFRCNLVTLSPDGPYAGRRMLDHSADEIPSDEARSLIEAVNAELRTDAITFYPGVSYRHLMVWRDGPTDLELTPPHDILGKSIAGYLPAGAQADMLLAMMERSAAFLPEHPVNRDRIVRGLRPANSIWIWGAGRRPQLSRFPEKYGVQGSVISAVDLIKGIGVCAGLTPVDVPGATGNIHTNFAGKAAAAIAELQRGQEFVYIHVEAPDESGHRHEVENKVKAIEAIDRQVLRPIFDALERMGTAFSILVLPDHPTPLSLRTHTDEPVPFLLYRSTSQQEPQPRAYDEESAGRTGLMIEEGYTLMDRFLGREAAGQ